MPVGTVNTSATTNSWVVYIIQCSDDSLYTGITNNLERRFKQHQRGKGAKYFRGREPVSVVYQENHGDRCSASRREFAIKQLNKKDKLALIEPEIAASALV